MEGYSQKRSSKKIIKKKKMTRTISENSRKLELIKRLEVTSKILNKVKKMMKEIQKIKN